MSALQKARAHYDQQPRQERAATGNAAGSAGLGMRHLEVRLLSDSLRASKLHAHLQSQRGFAHLQSLHLSAGQALPPRSSSYLGAPCAPCGRQCRCAACAPCARQCRCGAVPSCAKHCRCTECATCTRRCRCAACTGCQAPIPCCAASLASDKLLQGPSSHVGAWATACCTLMSNGLWGGHHARGALQMVVQHQPACLVQ